MKWESRLHYTAGFDMMQREDHAVTVAEAKRDHGYEAISFPSKCKTSCRAGIWREALTNSDHIILKEEDFKA